MNFSLFSSFWISVCLWAFYLALLFLYFGEPFLCKKICLEMTGGVIWVELFNACSAAAVRATSGVQSLVGWLGAVVAVVLTNRVNEGSAISEPAIGGGAVSGARNPAGWPGATVVAVPVQPCHQLWWLAIPAVQ